VASDLNNNLNNVVSGIRSQ